MSRISQNGQSVATARRPGRCAFVAVAGFLLLAPWAQPWAADAEPLSPGDGYLLLRVNVTQREKVSRLSFTNIDSGEIVTIRTQQFHAAGANAWMALVPAPAGRYFWSEFETTLTGTVESARNLEPMHSRNQPSSPEDSFEIVAGVINYVGDWTMRITGTSRQRLDPLVTLEKATLERYVADYPSLVDSYAIYLSMMGKKAISLDELAKIIESHHRSRSHSD